jgi:hypothetical protein
MDILQFIVEILKTTAWPGVVVFAILKLRDPIAGLIPNMEELRYKDLILKFRAGIASAKVEAPTPTVESGDATAKSLPAPPNDGGALYKVASVAPAAAVLQAWAILQDSLVNKAMALNLISVDSGIRGSSRLGHVLLNAKAITEEDFKLFHKLRELRNLAAHDVETKLTEPDARDYIALVLSFVARVI